MAGGLGEFELLEFGGEGAGGGGLLAFRGMASEHLQEDLIEEGVEGGIVFQLHVFEAGIEIEVHRGPASDFPLRVSEEGEFAVVFRDDVGGVAEKFADVGDEGGLTALKTEVEEETDAGKTGGVKKFLQGAEVGLGNGPDGEGEITRTNLIGDFSDDVHEAELAFGQAKDVEAGRDFANEVFGALLAEEGFHGASARGGLLGPEHGRGFEFIRIDDSNRRLQNGIWSDGEFGAQGVLRFFLFFGFAEKQRGSKTPATFWRGKEIPCAIIGLLVGFGASA